MRLSAFKTWAIPAAVAASLALAGTARASIVDITFDDLSDNGGGTPIANGYQGLNWSNFYVLNTSLYEASGYVNGVVSPPNVAYNGFGDPASISAAPGTNFTLFGGFFTAAWNNGLQINAQAYDTFGNPIAADNVTFTENTFGPQEQSFNWANIGSVTFTSFGGTPAGYDGSGEHFALDNLYVSEVPLPGAMPLFGAALAGLGGLGFWRRKAAK